MDEKPISILFVTIKCFYKTNVQKMIEYNSKKSIYEETHLIQIVSEEPDVISSPKEMASNPRGSWKTSLIK